MLLVLACAVFLLVVMPVLLLLVGRFIHANTGPGRMSSKGGATAGGMLADRSPASRSPDYVPDWIRSGPPPGKGYLWRKNHY